MQPPWGIIHEQAFEDWAARSANQFSRHEDWWLAWSWRFVRDPMRDAVVLDGSNPPIYMIKPHGFFEVYGVPPATLYYRLEENVDGKNIIMLDVRSP